MLVYTQDFKDSYFIFTECKCCKACKYDSEDQIFFILPIFYKIGLKCTLNSIKNNLRGVIYSEGRAQDPQKIYQHKNFESNNTQFIKIGSRVQVGTFLFFKEQKKKRMSKKRLTETGS